MIAEKSHALDVKSTITGKKVELGIDQAAMAHIMNVLTDLYSDPELAVIREYSTNALDAHVEAGQTKPIEVDLPSHLSPFFKVKDYGTGLNLEDIQTIYSRYGASTKRETNEQVGTLGLGCKSALTYTNQFTLVAVKDGVRTTVSISRDEDGGGSMTVVDESPSDDENGVEIVVPAKTGHSFETKAKRFFQWWEPGTVLVNGKEPKTPETLEISENIRLVNTASIEGDPYATPTSQIVMGNVAYPAPNLQTNLGYQYRVIARVPIGDVLFTPSREALQNTTKTKETLARVEQELRDGLQVAIQKDIDAQPDRFAALDKMLEWRRAAPNAVKLMKLRFKKEEFPTEYVVGQYEFTIVPGSYYKLSEHRTFHSVNIESFPNTLWFYNYDRANFTAGQRKKLNKWLEDNKLDDQYKYPNNFVLMKKKPDHQWIDPKRIFDWDDVQAIKLPRAERTSSGRIAGSYDLYRYEADASGNKRSVKHDGIPADDLDTKKPLYYIVGAWYEGSNIAKLIFQTEPDATVLIFASTRKNKFVRNFPMAKDAKEELDQRFETWKKNISKSQREALAMKQMHRTDALTAIDPKKVDDPELKAQIALASVDTGKLSTEIQQWRNVGKLYDVRKEAPASVLNKYPLFDQYKMRDKRTAREVYIYLNASYEARKKGDK